MFGLSAANSGSADAETISATRNVFIVISKVNVKGVGLESYIVTIES